MVRNFVLVSGIVILAAGTALATDAPKPRYVEVVAPSQLDTTSGTGSHTEHANEQIIIQRFGGDKDGRRSSQRHLRWVGPDFHSSTFQCLGTANSPEPLFGAQEQTKRKALMAKLGTN